ncbi:ribosomal protein S10p/S20e [Colletotrichum higginsianum]|nr:ribosomal protein S10p/S20e [Colletotrichum higginsianum]
MPVTSLLRPTARCLARPTTQAIAQRQPWLRSLATSTQQTTSDKPEASLRNLEFFADFALRAAYYLKLPAFGPVPLPRITERWTVPRSSFIFKKSQENFERVTLRRLVQIRDGNPETVQLWLAFLQKHAYYGIGMKANVWDFDKLGVGKTMDTIDQAAGEVIESKWSHLGQNRDLDTVKKVEEFLDKVRFDIDSDKRAEGERRFVQGRYKREEALKRKEAAAAASNADS